MFKRLKYVLFKYTVIIFFKYDINTILRPLPLSFGNFKPNYIQLSLNNIQLHVLVRAKSNTKFKFKHRYLLLYTYTVIPIITNKYIKKPYT